MKRSNASRGLAILWVLVMTQVMLTTANNDDSVESDNDGSKEVYRMIRNNKALMVTNMINNKGLEKASKQFNMLPLSPTDMNPSDDDDDDVSDTAVVKEQPQQHCQRPRLQTPAHVAPEVDRTETRTEGEQEAVMSRAESAPLEIGNDETMSTRRGQNPSVNNFSNGQEFRGYPQILKSASERSRAKRLRVNRGESPEKRWKDSLPMVMV